MFAGRTDFLGSEDGGCIRTYGEAENFEWFYQGHLTGSRPPIGIYPVVTHHEMAGEALIRKQFVVKFGAIDIDVEDFQLTLNLWRACQALGLSPHVERSRSKGYHVWVFADEWVPAVLMRSALQVACDIVHYNPKEIYPKQAELADGSPGNYIRLPYPGALARPVPERRVVLDDGGQPISLERFVEQAWGNRCSRAALENAASLAAPPKPRKVLRREGEPTAEVTSLVPKMGGLAFTIWENGPLEGGDRSGTLFKLVHAVRDSGLTPNEAFLVLEDADERWGKFADRADKDDRLWEIIDRVYE